MPLKCLSNDETLYAFDYPAQEWEGLKAENLDRHHLKMPCCDARVVLKTSKLGTRFFAHASIGECTTASETAEHLFAKNTIAKAVRAAGWEVSTECPGCSPDGEKWVADVMAIKDHRRVAIEVQWSRQDPEETKRRQERYMHSGVRGLWLMRHLNLLMDKQTPTFRLRYGENASNVTVLMPSPSFDIGWVGNHNKDEPGYWSQEIDLDRFVVGALNGGLKFAPAIGQRMPVSVSTSPALCWRCKKETNIVIGIEFQAGCILPGHRSIRAQIYDFEEIYGCESFLDTVFPHALLKQHGIGQIKRRFSRTVGGEYLSNGCVHCDALQGRFFDHDYWYEAKPTYTVETELSDSWACQLLNSYDEMFRWWFDEELAESVASQEG